MGTEGAMTAAGAAEESLRSGDPAAALAQLQAEVRAHPEDPKLRVFLFQLLCVLGQWERALTQLTVASTLDAGALAMAQTYGAAVQCEAVRRDVFEGRKSPMIFGQPDQWLALLIESLLVGAGGEAGRAEQLRQQAFADAEPSSGEVNGQPFDWIADADSRLGPVLEAVINGRYYWVPFSRLQQITLEEPEDLRDVVWMPAHLRFENGGEAVALIPTRYPGSETSGDGLLALARKTVWEEIAPGAHRGLGQRLLSTDDADVPLMDVRTLVIHGAGQPSDGEPSAGDAGDRG
jgi:type VI secretion system protein ImpE